MSNKTTGGRYGQMLVKVIHSIYRQMTKFSIFYICKCKANFSLILSNKRVCAGLPNKY